MQFWVRGATTWCSSYVSVIRSAENVSEGLFCTFAKFEIDRVVRRVEIRYNVFSIQDFKNPDV